MIFHTFAHIKIKVVVGFVKNKFFWINVLGAFSMMILLFFLLFQYLNIYTRHGESVTVPNLIGLRIDQIEEVMYDKGLVYIVVDSIFDANKETLAILDQDPKAESEVKSGRKVYLVINSGRAPMVVLPDLLDLTQRAAESELKVRGFELGKIITTRGPSSVQEMKHKGRTIEAGTELPKGSVIDLVIGDNSEVEDNEEDEFDEEL
jgi:beta-lactam-binding protein with PASTA domain